MNELIKKLASAMDSSPLGLAEKLNMSFDDLAKMDPKDVLSLVRENFGEIMGPQISSANQPFTYDDTDFKTMISMIPGLDDILKELEGDPDPKKEEGPKDDDVNLDEPEGETYTIKRGDTLSALAQQFDTTVDALMEANPYIEDKNRIFTGNQLVIPGQTPPPEEEESFVPDDTENIDSPEGEDFVATENPIQDLLKNLGNVDLNNMDLNQLFNNLPKNQLTTILSQLMNQDASVLDAPADKQDGDRFDFGFADKAPIRAKNRRKVIDFIKKLGIPQEGKTESGFQKGPGPLLQKLFGKTSKGITDIDEMAQSFGVDISQFTGPQLNQMRKFLKTNLPEGQSIGDFIKGGGFKSLFDGTSDMAGNISNMFSGGPGGSGGGGLGGQAIMSFLGNALQGAGNQNPGGVPEETAADKLGKIQDVGQIGAGLLTGNPLAAVGGFAKLFGRKKLMQDARRQFAKQKQQEKLPGVVGEQVFSEISQDIEDLESSARARELHGGRNKNVSFVPDSEKAYFNPLLQFMNPNANPMMTNRRFAGGGKIPSNLSPYLSDTYKRYLEGGTTESRRPEMLKYSYKSGGMVKGPSHKNGGVKFDVGGEVVELEGGEAVINKKSTKMFKDILSKINQAGGGVKFGRGGMLGDMDMSSPYIKSMLNRIGKM